MALTAQSHPCTHGILRLKLDTSLHIDPRAAHVHVALRGPFSSKGVLRPRSWQTVVKIAQVQLLPQSQQHCLL